MPSGAYTAYTWAALFLVFTATMRLRGREVAAVAILVGAQYVLPVVLQALQYNVNGPVWQGRYTLPLTVAVPIFALMLGSQRERSAPGDMWWRRTCWAYPVAVGVLAYAHLHAFVAHLRRNVSGYGGPSVTAGPWEPYGSAELVLAAEIVVVLLVLTAVVRMYWHDAGRPRSWAPAVPGIGASSRGGASATAELQRTPEPDPENTKGF